MTIAPTAAFIPAVTKALVSNGKFAATSACWVNQKRAFRPSSKVRTRHTVCAQAYTASSAAQDDDDESFGGEQPIYGMRLPNLSPEDREYLDSASSNKEFMRRMVEIAHHMDQRRHIDTLASGRQTPDQYVEGLSSLAKEDTKKDQSPPQPTRVPPPPPLQTAPQFTNSKPSPAPHTESASVEDIDAQIAELNRQLVEANETGANSTNQSKIDDGETGSLDDLESHIERLNRNVEQVVNDPDEKAETTGSLRAFQAEDNQDDLAEEEVEKRMEDIRRKLAEAAEKGTTVMSDSMEPAPPMTAEELKENFKQSEALRQKIRAEMGADREVPSNDNDKDDRTSSLERQIAAVQKEMEKLQLEEEDEDPQGNMRDDLSADWDEDDLPAQSHDAVKSKASKLLEELERKKTVSYDDDAYGAETVEPRYEGLENTPGEMSADEKKRAFELLRKQVMEQNNEHIPGDPYNTVLPEKRERPIERELVDEEGDVPSGDEEEFDSFGPIAGDRKQLVEELEEETKKYIAESRRLLQEHEVKVNVLLSRLMLSFEE